MLMLLVRPWSAGVKFGGESKVVHRFSTEWGVGTLNLHVEGPSIFVLFLDTLGLIFTITLWLFILYKCGDQSPEILNSSTKKLNKRSKV